MLKKEVGLHVEVERISLAVDRVERWVILNTAMILRAPEQERFWLCEVAAAAVVVVVVVADTLLKQLPSNLYPPPKLENPSAGQDFLTVEASR
jgi:hypothetical protein